MEISTKVWYEFPENAKGAAPSFSKYFLVKWSRATAKGKSIYKLFYRQTVKSDNLLPSKGTQSVTAAKHWTPLMHSVSAFSVHRKNRQADSTCYSQDLERIHNAHWDSRWCSDKLSDICRNYESWQTRFLLSISDNRAHSHRNIQKAKYVKKNMIFLGRELVTFILNLYLFHIEKFLLWGDTRE